MRTRRKKTFWVLRDRDASRQERKPIYFKVMGPEGPETTPSLAEAMRFKTQGNAVLDECNQWNKTFLAEEIA